MGWWSKVKKKVSHAVKKVAKEVGRVADQVTGGVASSYVNELGRAWNTYTGFYQDAIDIVTGQVDKVDDGVIGGEEINTTSNEGKKAANYNRLRNARLSSAYSLGNTNSQRGQRRTGGYIGGRTTGGYGGKKDSA